MVEIPRRSQQLLDAPFIGNKNAKESNELDSSETTSSTALTEEDVLLVSDIYNRCAARIESANLGRVAPPSKLDMTQIVDQVLDEGNKIPQDIHRALNMLVLAAPLIEISPLYHQTASFLNDLDKLGEVLERSSAALKNASNSQPESSEARLYLSNVFIEVKKEIDSRKVYIHENHYSSILQYTPQCAKDIEPSINNLTEFKERINATDPLVPKIDARIATLTQLRESNPLTEKAVFGSKIYAAEAALRVIDTARNTKTPQSRDYKILTAAIDTLKQRIEQMRLRNSIQTLDNNEIRNLLGGEGKYKPGNPKDVPADILNSIDDFINTIEFSDSRSDNGIVNNTSTTRVSRRKTNDASWQNDSDSSSVSSNEANENEPLLSVLRAPTFALPLSHDKIREEGIMAAFTEKVFLAANIIKPQKKGFWGRLFATSNKKIDKLLRDAHLAVRDSKDWKNISKPIQVFNDGIMHTITSVITPQSGIMLPSPVAPNRLGKNIQQERTGAAPIFNSLTDSARENIHAFPDLIDTEGRQNGVNSHRSMAYRHAPHLANTVLKAEDGSVLFSATRHATLSAYGISSDALENMSSPELEAMVQDLLHEDHWIIDDQSTLSVTSTALRIKTDKHYRKECVALMREAAAFNRAKDVVRTTVAANPQLFLAAKQAAENGTSVSMNINHISLLTPDYARLALARIGVIGASENEYDMTQEQYHAWDKIRNNGQPIKLMLNDGDQPIEISVKVHINDFNFGVNQIGYALGSAFWSKEVLTRNHNAMLSMFGERANNRSANIGGQVGDWLEQNPSADPTKKRLIATLADQISDIWHDKSFKSAGTEPYKLVSRIAVLTHMIGNYADFNCKSGKDRTGELDVEAKYLAAQMDATGIVPTPDAERSLEERANFFRIAIEGGNHEMQQYSTGIAGYKIFGFKPLLEAISLNSEESGHGWQHKGESIRWFQGLSQSEGS
ncbi:inositol phosphate phosphatase SopB [Pseudochelatococcus sp. G4_1912]|uniref:inositol phosphate phosphatase SopB n=1 Tax=Pseudochelatococcus sp. G4_1912 TaxID=3114288 RepID=UPI0039C5F482